MTESAGIHRTAAVRPGHFDSLQYLPEPASSTRRSRPPALVRGMVGRGGGAATHAGGRAQCVVRSWAPSPIRKNSLQQHHPVRWLIIEKVFSYRTSFLAKPPHPGW